MRRRRGSRVRLLVTAVVVAAATMSATPSATAQQADLAPSWRSDATSTTVTLITGDRVLVGTGAAGERHVVQVLPAQWPGRRVAFRTWQSGSDTYVVPSDVDRLAPRVLDLALFNVSRLVAAGLDDTGRPTLPLLVQHEQGASPAALHAGGPLRAERELHSIRATAARLDKRQAARVGEALTGVQRQATTSGLAGGIDAGPLAGVTRIWLDMPVRPLLDANLVQVGAPAAWERGLSGSGVRVAVLDTGIDSGHPDLAGKVVAEADFSGSSGPGDRVGHGTHVAAIVAGTGAASGGERRGVAFGAQLLNGKVLDDSGFGTVSMAIAGMEWAVAQQADVVNMSIGLAVPSDGTDPWSQAVNALTASSGTLFVAAAGNNGPGPVEIGAPAAADAALTVGAVDAANQPAPFSSRGPRYGDRALKPDITAPGVDIVSARAAGTVGGVPVDDRYVRASGTSMASPHVAGAAALLAQRHPDWTARQLKAALVGTARPAPGVSGYAQGGGRVDVSRAVEARLLADTSGRRPEGGAVDFGTVPVNSATVTRTVTVRNTSSAAVTLDADASVHDATGRPAPRGLLAVSPRRLTLPANGTAAVTVTLRPTSAMTGENTGGLTLTPTSPGAGPALRLPVAAYVTPPTVTLNLRGLDRDGGPVRNGAVQLFNADDFVLTPAPRPENPGYIPLDDNGAATVQVVAGTYSTMSIWTDLSTSAALVGSLETTIRRDTTIVLDARAALPASATVDGIAGQSTAGLLVGYTRTDRLGRSISVEVSSSTGTGNPSALPVFVQPTSRVNVGGVETRAYWKITGTDVDGPAEVALPFVESGFRNPPRYRVTARELATYAQIEADYRSFGTAGLDYGVGQGLATPLRNNTFVLGSTGLTFPLSRTEYFRPDPRLRWFQCVAAFVPFGPPVDQHCELDLTTRRPGERSRKQWLTGPFDPTLGATRTADQVNLVHVSPHGDGDGRVQVNFPVIGLREATLRISRDGIPLGAVPAFWVPPDRPSSVRVEVAFVVDTGAVALPTDTRVAWTFTTRPPAGPGPAGQPILLADVRVPGLDGRNLAPPGQPLAIEVDAHTAPGARPAPVSSVELSVTPDDGQTWVPVTLTRGSDGRYRGQLPAELVRAGGALGTRVRAGDATGGTVEQTQLRTVRVAG